MKVALVNTTTPFVRGGAEILVDDLAEQLSLRGHEATIFRIPFPMDFGKPLLHTIESVKMMRFDSYDKVIAFKFPAYCVQHRDKAVWMFHQFRQVYDLWNTQYGLQDDPEGRAIRSVVVRADEDLRKARVFTNAQEVGNRLLRFNNISSEVLHPPLKDMNLYRWGETGEYLFYPSRVDTFKRQLLAIQAMAHTKSNVRLVISGRCEEPAYDEAIRQTIHKHHLQNRVQYENRWISDEEKRDLFSRCLGAMYLPIQEDSCGFVSMEAFYCAKPVITCLDSGGTLELVEDHKNGLLCEPTPESLALAMDNLYENRENAVAMGKDARLKIDSWNVIWEETIRRLLQ